MTDADKIMNPQRFGSDPANIYIRIRINSSDSNHGSLLIEVGRLGRGRRGPLSEYSLNLLLPLLLSWPSRSEPDFAYLWLSVRCAGGKDLFEFVVTIIGEFRRFVC